MYPIGERLPKSGGAGIKVSIFWRVRQAERGFFVENKAPEVWYEDCSVYVCSRLGRFDWLSLARIPGSEGVP
jgi:hypothetical protein